MVEVPLAISRKTYIADVYLSKTSVNVDYGLVLWFF